MALFYSLLHSHISDLTDRKTVMLFLLLYMLFPVVNLHGQVQIDSILNNLKGQPDTTIIKELNDLC